MYRNRWKDYLTSSAFVVPALLIFSLFYLYPLYKVFALSMYQWDGVSPTQTFVGIRHFRNVLLNDTYYWQSMRQAGYITIFALTLQNILALILALAVDRGIRRGGMIYRVIFFIPPVLSEIVVGLVWKWIFDGNWGLLNGWLINMGLEQLTHTWLGESATALTCVAIVHSWKGFGWGFIILLAGLQGIPREIYEAAEVDGASGLRTVWSITFPMLIPIIFMVTILTILGSMQAFVLILSMTGGGPGYNTEVPVTRILASMLSSSRFGYACAQAIIFGGILMVISFIQVKLSKIFKQD